MNGQSQVAKFDEMEPLESYKDGKGSGRVGEKAWTADRKGNRILVKDVVRAAKGKGPNVLCEVIWIYGGLLFLRATEALAGENAYIVTPGHRAQFIDRDAMRAERIADNIKKEAERVKAIEGEKGAQDVSVFGTDIRKASDTSFVKDWFKKLMGLPVDPKTTGLTREHKGVTVKITGGAYKGLRAEVRDVLGDQVRLSLLVKPKLVMVAMSNLARDDYTPTGKKNWLKSRDEATNLRNNAGEVYNPQPNTPPASTVASSVASSAPPSPGSDRPGGADDRALALIRETEKDDKADDADEWDPSFGVASSVDGGAKESVGVSEKVTEESVDGGEKESVDVSEKVTEESVDGGEKESADVTEKVTKESVDGSEKESVDVSEKVTEESVDGSGKESADVSEKVTQGSVDG